MIKKFAVTRYNKIIYLKAQQLQNLPLSQNVLYFVHGVYLLRLRVRVPIKSLFRDKNFAYFDFGVRSTPKILITFFRVPPKILKKWEFCLLPKKLEPPCSEPLSSKGKSSSRHQAMRQNPHFVQKFGRNLYENY